MAVDRTPYNQVHLTTLLDAVLVTGNSASVALRRGEKTIQAYIVGTGAVAATVKVQVANIVGQWIDLATIALTATTSDNDSYSWTVPWAYCRVSVTALTGTGAALTVVLGEE